MRNFTNTIVALAAALAIFTSFAACDSGSAGTTTHEMAITDLTPAQPTVEWKVYVSAEDQDLNDALDSPMKTSTELVISVPVDITWTALPKVPVASDSKPLLADAEQQYSAKAMKQAATEFVGSQSPLTPPAQPTVVRIALVDVATGEEVTTSEIQLSLDTSTLAYLDASVPADFQGELMVTVEWLDHFMGGSVEANGSMEVALN